MKCKYCKKPAGFLSAQHDECHQAFIAKRKAMEDARAEVVDAFSECVISNGDVSQLKSDVTKKLSICGDDTDDLLVKGWQSAISVALADDVLSEEEESTLTEMLSKFNLSQYSVGNEAYMKLAKGKVLREVLNGEMPNINITDTDISFNLQKSEKLIWVFSNVEYYKEVTRTHRVGGSQGVSIRVMRGVYYRVGGFKSQPVHTTNIEHLDSGVLGLTNKHIYFFGDSKRFRVAYAKIVAFEHFSDGIGIQRDLASAKPESFVTGDGWFTCNLVSNLSSIDLK